jgi:hypothetical protein
MFSVPLVSATINLPAILVGAVVVWLGLSAIVADYGRGRGFPFFPLFVCGVFLGWPLVLLAVTVAGRSGVKR